MNSQLARWSTLIMLSLLTWQGVAGQECVQWPRVLPPEGLAIPLPRSISWSTRIEALERELAAHPQAAYRGDVEVFGESLQSGLSISRVLRGKGFRQMRALADASRDTIRLAQRKERGQPGTLERPRRCRATAGTRFYFCHRWLSTTHWSGDARARVKERQEATAVCVVASVAAINRPICTSSTNACGPKAKWRRPMRSCCMPSADNAWATRTLGRPMCSNRSTSCATTILSTAIALS